MVIKKNTLLEPIKERERATKKEKDKQYKKVLKQTEKKIDAVLKKHYKGSNYQINVDLKEFFPDGFPPRYNDLIDDLIEVFSKAGWEVWYSSGNLFSTCDLLCFK